MRPGGNLTSDGAKSYLYDVENRLVQVTDGPYVTHLYYDPMGRLYRTTSTRPGYGTTVYLHDGDALVAEYDATGTMLRRHVHGAAAGVDDPLATFAGSGTDGSTAALLKADTRGSIVATTDWNGNLQVINTYDVYGIPGTGNSGRFQYTGQVWLPEIGLYYYKARIYSPSLGRFLQTDPIGYEDDSNLYGYVGSDPVNGVDPTGTSCTFNEDSGKYSCKVDSNTGKFTKSQIATIQRQYTLAVNKLMKDPDRHMTVKVGKDSMRVTAGALAKGLIKSFVRTSQDRLDKDGNPEARASTVGTLNDRQAPAITIFKTSLMRDRSGGTKFIERDLRRTLIHEAAHTIPQESAFQDQVDDDPKKFNDRHQNPYNDMATVFDNAGG